MLQKIRDHLCGWVAAIPFALIAVAFAFWGVDAPSLISGNYAAKINGEEIPLTEFRRAFQDRLNQFHQYYTDEIPPEIEDSIRQNVLNEYIRRALVEQHVRSAGYRIGDEALLESIKNMTAFQVGGQFSPESYRARLSLMGMSSVGFEEDQRKQLQADQLRDSVLQSAFLTDSEMRRFLELDREQREMAYIVFDLNAYMDAVLIDEATVTEHYESNRERYRTEETVTVEYLEVRLDDVAAEAVVSEDDVREYYSTVEERYVVPEKRNARHIIVAITADVDASAAETRAAEILNRLDAGESFDAVAAESSDDPDTRETGGVLGWMDREFMAEVMGNVIADVVFGMNPGQIEGPVRGEFGMHILQLDAIEAGEKPDFGSVRIELEREYRKLVAEEMFYERADSLEARAFEAWDELATVGEGLGLPMRTLTGFSRLGTGPFAGNSDVIETVFSEEVLENGQNSRLIPVTDEHSIVVRVRDHQPSVAKTLDDVRQEIRAELLREAARTHALHLGESVVDRVHAGEDLGTVLAGLGFRMPATRWVIRSDAAVPTDLLSAVFRTLPGADGAPVVDGVSMVTGSYAVFVLTGIRPGDAGSVSIAQYRSEAAQRSQQQALGELAAYVGELEADAKIVIGDINPDQL